MVALCTVLSGSARESQAGLAVSGQRASLERVARRAPALLNPPALQESPSPSASSWPSCELTPTMRGHQQEVLGALLNLVLIDGRSGALQATGEAPGPRRAGTLARGRGRRRKSGARRRRSRSPQAEKREATEKTGGRGRRRRRDARGGGAETPQAEKAGPQAEGETRAGEAAGGEAGPRAEGAG